MVLLCNISKYMRDYVHIPRSHSLKTWLQYHLDWFDRSDGRVEGGWEHEEEREEEAVLCHNEREKDKLTGVTSGRGAEEEEIGGVGIEEFNKRNEVRRCASSHCTLTHRKCLTSDGVIQHSSTSAGQCVYKLPQREVSLTGKLFCQLASADLRELS